jgi:ABC-2 type transport system permease protein
VRKYWLYFAGAFQIAFSYRASLVIRMIRDFLMVLFFITLWRALFAGKETIAGFTFSGMVSYYILAKAVDQLYTFDPGNVIERHVRSGDLSNFLAKPINYMIYLASHIFGRRLARTILTIIASIVIIIVFPSFVGYPAGIFETTAFFILIALAWLLVFAFSYLIGMISFWTTEISNIRQGFELLILILGGLWVPLNVLPDQISQILNYLPFKYLYYFPIQVYLGKVPVDKVFLGLITELCWILGLLFIAKYLWQRGLKRFGAYGN